MSYEVHMGFVNYCGEVYEVTPIAQFISKARAERYVEMCMMDDKEIGNEDVRYTIVYKR